MSKQALSDLEKFVRWFEVPYHGLKSHSDGDGAFIALSVGFLLFERYYRIITNTQDIVDFDTARNRGAKELDVNCEFFSIFWSTYRNGLMHQGTPRVYERDGIKYKWLIDGTFNEYPTYFDDNGFRYICLDPWKFTEFTLRQFINNPDRINGSIIYSLGDINEDKLPFTSIKVGSKDTYK